LKVADWDSRHLALDSSPGIPYIYRRLSNDLRRLTVNALTYRKGMTEKKDYGVCTDEELRSALKKTRSKTLTSAVFTGFLFGIILYGLAKNGFGLIYTLIPAILIYVNIRHAGQLKETKLEIQGEIDRRARSTS
jgi:hypothetical protein